MPKRATTDGDHLREFVPGQYSSEETSQRWRVVGDQQVFLPKIEISTLQRRSLQREFELHS